MSVAANRYARALMDVLYPDHAEQGLQQTRALLAAVVEASPLAIIVFDADGVVRRSNPAAERLLGKTASATAGSPVDNPVRPRADGPYRCVMKVAW